MLWVSFYGTYFNPSGCLPMMSAWVRSLGRSLHLFFLAPSVYFCLSVCVSLCPAPGLCTLPRVPASFSVPGFSSLLHPPGDPGNGARGASAFIPIQVATIQDRIYGALTLSRQEGTARLMGWAGWGNNRLFDVTSLIGVDLLTD